MTRLPRYFEPLRHPRRTGLSLTSCQLIHELQSPLGFPVLPLVSSACMPSPLPRQVGWTSFARTISILVGLPQLHGGSAPAVIVSRPAQRSLTLWPARSRSRLATLFTESSDRFVTSAVVSVATGWSEPVPGRELHPLKSSAFSRRTCNGDISPIYGNRYDRPIVRLACFAATCLTNP